MDSKLIMTIVNGGHAETVMDAAREAGARGGTILEGRGTSSTDKTIMGIRIEPEKDIVLIIASNDKVKAIVESVYNKAGLKTDGSGICFVMPIDYMVGGQS